MMGRNDGDYLVTREYYCSSVTFAALAPWGYALYSCS